MKRYGKRCIFGLAFIVSFIMVLLRIYFTSKIRAPAPMTRSNAKENRLLKPINHKSDKTQQSMSVYGENRSTAYLQDPLLEMEKLLENQLDLKKTKITILGKKKIFAMGDIVQLRITLHKKDGSPRLTGGDKLRVRLFEARLNASASGRVVDHGNGSHTAEVKCLWTGSPLIRVYLSSMAEFVEFLQRTTANISAIRITNAVYKNGEIGACHPLRKWLTESHGICNMTSRNGGMSWYCECPKSGRQMCDDFQHYAYRPAAYNLFLRVFGSSKKPMDPVQITVKDKTKFVKPPKLSCSRYNRTKLWTLPSPIGYFYKNKWKLLHCTPPTSGMITDCLRHKHLVMYGDSTARQWFVEISRRFKCTLVTEKWTQPKWSHNSRIYCHHSNLTVDLIFHAQPGNFDNEKVVFDSISKHMLNFYKRTDVIFLISVHLHFNAYQPILYRDRIQHIARSVGKLLKGNPNSKILFKGGHTAWTMFSYKSDIFRNIVTQEFAEMHESVIYLDNKDITMSKLITDSHPPSDIVSVMVDHMLGYVCN